MSGGQGPLRSAAQPHAAIAIFPPLPDWRRGPGAFANLAKAALDIKQSHPINATPLHMQGPARNHLGANNGQRKIPRGLGELGDDLDCYRSDP
jgi:hypothetical protein